MNSEHIEGAWSVATAEAENWAGEWPRAQSEPERESHTTRRNRPRSYAGAVRLTLLLLSVSLLGLPLCADVCNPKDLQGAYGFQLSGVTTISGEAKPVTNLGRVILAEGGVISGYSTAMFAGFLLGNPVTGTYEARPDCTISWILQDDSGASQHFSGVATTDGKRVHFSQTDPGGAQSGIMAKTSAECKTSDRRKEYQFALSGTALVMVPGGPASTVAEKGLIKADDAGNFKVALGTASTATTAATITVDGECIVEMLLVLPAKDAAMSAPIKLRGILIDEGRQIIAIQTDPGAMVSATFTAQ
jgi:hypothetical protein